MDPPKVYRRVDLAAKKRNVYSNFVNVQRTEPEITPSERMEDFEQEKNRVVTPARDIEVTGCGESLAIPDCFRAMVVIRSTKHDPQDAKNSVQRRLDYVLQTFRSHGAKDGDLSVNKLLLRDGRQYVMQAEVGADMREAARCQQAVSVLSEKLDENVILAPPTASVSHSRLESARKNAVLAATRSARAKAQEIGTFLHLSVGRCLQLKENEVSESLDDVSGCPAAVPALLLQQVHQKTVSVQASVSATFQLRHPHKKGS